MPSCAACSAGREISTRSCGSAATSCAPPCRCPQRPEPSCTMAEPTSIGLALAFSAGLLSFLSPCVLPLIPSYLTFVTGVGLDDLGTVRRSAILHALLFVLGFTLIFVALGASATVLGRLLVAYRIWITRAGGALVVLF